MLLVLKTEEGAVSQGVASRSWKRQSKDLLPLSLQKEPALSAWGGTGAPFWTCDLTAVR